MSILDQEVLLERAERNALIYYLREDGETFRAIADACVLSVERVRQLYHIEQSRRRRAEAER